jgi:hypothetical protein
MKLLTFLVPLAMFAAEPVMFRGNPAHTYVPPS